MLEDVEVSRSVVKRMKSTGEMTETHGIEIREEAIHSDGNRPITEETTNPINENLIENKHRHFSEKTLVPNAIKGLGDLERDHSALTTGI